MTAVIGLTGGFCSGKSTVARFFRELGAPIIDADAIAKALVLPGTPAYQQIVEHFGSAILDMDPAIKSRDDNADPTSFPAKAGNPDIKKIENLKHSIKLQNENTLPAINRSKLRTIVFKEPNEKAWLEALLHPMIYKKIQEDIKTMTAPYCIVEIPLLAESKHAYDFLTRTLVIDTPYENQITFGQSRGFEPKEIDQIISQQATREARLRIADDVIENTQSLDALKQIVLNLHKKYLLGC